MSNPLAIPDIIAKVIENLDTKDLVKVSYLNKTWRLEARRKLYQDRSNIIYSFLEPFLNVFRVSYGITTNPMAMRINLALKEFRIFRKTFNLDAKIELLAIRDILRKEYKKLRNSHKKLVKKVNKCNYAMEGLAMNSEEYRQIDGLCWKRTLRADEAREKRFNSYRDLVNFEYFLSGLQDNIFDKNEINAINSKARDLQEEELEYFYY